MDTNESERAGTTVLGTSPPTGAPATGAAGSTDADAGASAVHAAGDAPGTTGTRDTAAVAGAPSRARSGSAAAEQLSAPLRTRTRAAAVARVAADAPPPAPRRTGARKAAAGTTGTPRKTTAGTAAARSTPAKAPAKKTAKAPAKKTAKAAVKKTAVARTTMVDPNNHPPAAAGTERTLPPSETPPPVSQHGGSPGGSGLRLLVARTVVVVVLLALGAIVGVTTATGAAPAYTADSQVLMRVRDYAAVILGPGSVFGGSTPQRAVAAQVLAAQASSFTFEVARQAKLDPAVVAAALTVTASPDADVIVFSAASRDPAVAVAVADTAGRYEVSTYRDQLVLGLGTIAAGNTLDAAQLAQLAQVQAFERISPSAQVITAAGAASGGPVPASRGLLVGAAAGAVVAFLLLAADQALRSRRRSRRVAGLPPAP